MRRKLLLLLALLVLAPPAAAVQLELVTSTPRDENWASWHPDGITILISSGPAICHGGEWFCGEQDIWQARYDDAQLLSLDVLASDAYHPRISPDGQWVAAMVFNGTDYDIFVWPFGNFLAGSTFQSLPGYQERFPNWSNDSRYIAFDSNRASARPGGQNYQVFYAALADRGTPGAAVQVTQLGTNNKHPTWNHDDSELAYVGNANNKRSISAVRLSDGHYREITPELSQNRHPDWSPDGRWIAFVTDRWDGIGDVAITRADGLGEPVRVTVGMEGHDDFPEWSQDSQRLVFCGTRIEPPFVPNKEIYIASDLPLAEASGATSFGAWKAGGR